jgi:tetratricopeptide (TPR) repeat protein
MRRLVLGGSLELVLSVSLSLFGDKSTTTCTCLDSGDADGREALVWAADGARTGPPAQLNSTVHLAAQSTSPASVFTPPAAMSHANLLSPPSQIPPPTALALAQKAPRILSSTPTSALPWPLSLLFSRETPETWTIHENLFLSTLRTGNEEAALRILQRLEARFGDHNERIITLRGIYNEATSKSDADLEKVLNGYDKIIKDDPTNMSIRKRRVAVLKALGRTQDAITAVAALLQDSPTDAEAWAEASELYASTAAWGQAIFCAEEVLLITPNAWTVSRIYLRPYCASNAC